MLQNLFKRFALTDRDTAPVSAAGTTEEVHEVLQGLASRTPSQQGVFAAIGKFRGQSAILHAIDLVNARMPKFMYFSHYDRMSGELSINKWNTDKANGVKIESGIWCSSISLNMPAQRSTIWRQRTNSRS